MQERVGFEPTDRCQAVTRFRVEPVQPLRHLSAVDWPIEALAFELE